MILETNLWQSSTNYNKQRVKFCFTVSGYENIGCEIFLKTRWNEESILGIRQEDREVRHNYWERTEIAVDSLEIPVRSAQLRAQCFPQNTNQPTAGSISGRRRRETYSSKGLMGDENVGGEHLNDF